MKKTKQNSLTFIDLRLGMAVKDELHRKGTVISLDDIDNIQVSLGSGRTEYYSLTPNNPNGVSILYRKLYHE